MSEPSVSAGACDPDGGPFRTGVDLAYSERARKGAEASAAAKRRRAEAGAPRLNPITSDRPYTTAEVEFMRAMEDYKNRTGRKFPAWSEVLGVLRSLGYARGGGAR